MWRAGRDWLAGSSLVFVGLLLLAERRMPGLVPLIPLIVGLVLLLLCLVRRSPMALAAGCVLTGAGIGVLVAGNGSDSAAVVFLACLAAGFGAAWLLGLVFRMRPLFLWPLLVAAVFGGIAVLAAVGGWGDELQRVAAGWWPVAVVLLGAVLLLGARAGRRRHGPDDDTRMVPIVSGPPPDAGW
jgi:hypothetical protein